MVINLESIRERDIDLLLIRLISTCKVVRNFILDNLNLANYKIERISHSIMNEHGESDLVLLCSNNGKRVSAHIENKIDAQAQPDQFERYQIRCNQEMEMNNCSDFRICIFCPEKYYLNNQEAKKYPYHILYEDILNILKENSPKNFGIKLLEKAIEKSHHKVASKSEKMTSFWNSFFDYIDANYIGIKKLNYNRMKELGPRSFWRDFKTSVKGIRIIYKANKGFVDIEFTGHDDHDNQILSFIGWKFGPMPLLKSGKSTIIRLKTSKMDFQKSFDEQIYEVHEALEQIWKASVMVDQMKAKGIANIL